MRILGLPLPPILHTQSILVVGALLTTLLVGAGVQVVIPSLNIRNFLFEVVVWGMHLFTD